jgi:hypothetical protein
MAGKKIEKRAEGPSTRPQRKHRYSKEAFAALKRYCGASSHGSSGHDIDEELYGPMSEDSLESTPLERATWKLLHSAQRRFSVKEWDGIWRHAILAEQREDILAKIKKRFPNNCVLPDEEGWLDFSVRGKSERKAALDWEALQLVDVFFRSHYATSYHALKEILAAVREKRAITAHMLARQMFDIATSVLFVSSHLELARVLVSSITAEWEGNLEKKLEQWAQWKTLGSSAELLNATRRDERRDCLSDEVEIIHGRVARRLGAMDFQVRYDPELPTFMSKVDGFLSAPSVRQIHQQFEQINCRCEALDKLDPVGRKPLMRWHRLLNRGKTSNAFQSCHVVVWKFFSAVTHGISGFPKWRLTGEGSAEIKDTFDEGFSYHALLYMATVCFSVIEACFREVFNLPPNEFFDQHVEELKSISPGTGQRMNEE